MAIPSVSALRVIMIIMLLVSMAIVFTFTYVLRFPLPIFFKGVLPKRLPNESISDRTYKIAYASLSYTNIEYVIAIYNPRHDMGFKNYLLQNCSFRNCNFTIDRNNLQNQSAIIFGLTASPVLPWKPPISPSSRHPDQVWIFYWKEAAARHLLIRQWKVYTNPYWRNTVNWTMSYTSDADIFCPYGELNERSPPARNYSEIFHRKTNMAAWVVSNCNTPGKRRRFVDELRKHNFTIDMYGRCAGKRVDPTAIRRKIDLNYKFYLALENSFCKDYITEKFFSYFNLDVILVVRGEGNYTRFARSDSYINTADFKSVKDLAKHLLAVASNETLYTSYLRNKDKYETQTYMAMDEPCLCQVCEKLNNLDRNRRVYTDLVDRIHRGTCHKPNDIH